MIITFCCLAVLCTTAPADTIVLKNGDRIYAESVKEYNGRVEYWVGNNSMTIPKSIVARIESGGAPTLPAESAASANVEVPRLNFTLAGADELVSRVIRNGAVDATAIHAIEQEGSPEQS